jgi:hypothetical protein
MPNLDFLVGAKLEGNPCGGLVIGDWDLQDFPKQFFD